MKTPELFPCCLLRDRAVPTVGVNRNAILEELDQKRATALYLSEHRSETQFPRCGSEFLLRTDEVTHTCLFSRAAQEHGEKKHLTVQACDLQVSFFFECFECVVGWAGA